MDGSDREEQAHRDFSCLRWPYDELWFIHRHYYWWRDLFFERRQRQHGHYPVFAGLHNTEVFALPATELPMQYVSVPEWWQEIEVSSLLKVLSPSVFAYYRNRVISGTPWQADTIWRIKRSEWAFMNIISFLAACRDGVVSQSVGKDTRLSYFGIIVPLPRRLTESVTQLSFFKIVRSKGFDARLSYLSYSIAQEVDWSSHPISCTPYFSY